MKQDLLLLLLSLHHLSYNITCNTGLHMGQGGPGTKALPNSTGSGNSGKYAPSVLFVRFSVFSVLFLFLPSFNFALLFVIVFFFLILFIIVFAAQMLMDYISGRLGGPNDIKLASKIVRVIVAGNSVVPSDVTKGKDRLVGDLIFLLFCLYVCIFYHLFVYLFSNPFSH